MTLNFALNDFFANTPAIILAGGLGTRLRSVVADRPKVLAPVAGRPFLAHLLDQLARAGWQRAILCTGYLGEQIEHTFGTHYGGLSLRYSREDAPLGTGGAVSHALAQAKPGDSTFLVINGDSYVNADLDAFVRWHMAGASADAGAHGRDGSLLLTWVDDAARFGTVEVDGRGTVATFIEKRGVPVPGWINAGVYLLSRSLVGTIPAAPEAPSSIERDCFPHWVSHGLGGFCAKAEFIDIGTPESFARAEHFFEHLAASKDVARG